MTKFSMPGAGRAAVAHASVSQSQSTLVGLKSGSPHPWGVCPGPAAIDAFGHNAVLPIANCAAERLNLPELAFSGR